MRDLTIIVQNPTTNTGVACLYWMYSAGSYLPPPVWNRTRADPSTPGSVTWNPVWQFVWAEAQSLNIGVVVTAGDTVNADLTYSNQINLSYSTSGGYSFSGLCLGPYMGTLTTICDGTIPSQQVAIGLAMRGAPLVVSIAEANLTAEFTPPDQLWIAFANDVKEGEIIDPSTMSGATQIVFPADTFSMTATLNADGTWSVAPTPA